MWSSSQISIVILNSLFCGYIAYLTSQVLENYAPFYVLDFKYSNAPFIHLYSSFIEEFHLFLSVVSCQFYVELHTAALCHFALVCLPPPHSEGNMRSAWCWSARQNRFRDPGGTEQCHHRSLKPLRLRNNLSPSALSEVIRGRSDSRQMGGIFSSATLGAVIRLSTSFYILPWAACFLVSSVLCSSIFLPFLFFASRFYMWYRC